MRKFSPALLLSLSFIFGVLGCGGNSAGVITSTISPSATQSLDAGQSVAFTATVAGDSSNAGVTWSLLSSGSLSNQTSTSVTYTAPTTVAGLATAAVLATPIKNTQFSASTAINLAPALAMTKPALPAAKAAIAYSYQLASTGGTAPITWSITSGALPLGLSLSSTGLISGTPTTPGTATFTIGATDAATTPVTVTSAQTLAVATATLAITTASVPNGIVGKAYSSTLTSISGVGALTWTVSAGALPAGLALSTAGVLSGSPSTAGTFNFTAQVVDSSTPQQKTTQVFTFTIYAPLAITPATLANGSIKDAYTATLQSTGGATPITWTVSSGTLPAGLSLSAGGVITGTPTTVGNSTFTIQAADSFAPQQTATASFTISIVLSTLAITTTTLPAGTIGTAYSSTLVSSGGNPPVTWSLASGSSLPAGLTLSAAGVISGNPTTAATTSFTVQATDSTPATVTQVLAIKVVPPSTLKLTTTSLPTANIGSAYSTTLAATLGNPPYTWAISSGTLPAGMTFTTTGVLSGTPYIAGTYNLTFAVTDSTQATVTAALPLTVGTTLTAGAGDSLLSGSYAFLISGKQSGSSSGKVYGFAAVGSLTTNGTGTVTGVEDMNTASGVQTAVPVTGGYTLGADGRGYLVLTAGSATTVYVIAASNTIGGVAQSIAITEFDNATGTGAVASGIGRHQTAAAFAASTINGTFVFGLSGESPCNTCFTPTPRFGPMVAVGLFTADGVSTLSSGLEDSAAHGQDYDTGITLSGKFTAPSTTTGRGTLTLVSLGTTISAPPTDYTYVIVSANELLLLSNDSHATTSLLFGDVQLQKQATYTNATAFTGTSIAYESQASGGDGSSIYPPALNAILTEFTNTGSGTGTFLQDSNRAGTYTAGTATNVSYIPAANGRTTITTGGISNQVLYLYNVGAGFALDLATSTTNPGLAQYELQVANSPEPPLLYGSYADGTLATPVASTMSSGTASFSFYTGGVNGGIDGKVVTTTDSNSVAGPPSLAQAGTATYAEDLTGRFVLADPTTSATTGVTYAITGARAVSIPTSSSTTPVISVLQQ